MSVNFTAGLIAAPSVPLTHARIGYQSIITESNATGTAGSSGWPFISALNPATFERWKPTSPAAVNIDYGSDVEVDYVALQCLGVSGVTVEYSDDNVAFTEAIAYTDNSESQIGLFWPVTARYWQITITGTDLSILKLNLGKALAMQRALYAGHSPVNLSRVTAVRPSVSESGQWLGAKLDRLGASSSIDWNNLSASWYRANFDPFVAQSPRVNPFFLAWRPETFPDEVAYCWATRDIQPSNTGPRDLMSVDMQIEAYL